MSKHNMTICRSGFTNGQDWECEYFITYNYTPGRPEQGPTYSCGGTPADPAEVEVVDIELTVGDFDTKREKDEALDWANEYLQDNGYDKAIENAGGF